VPRNVGDFMNKVCKGVTLFLNIHSGRCWMSLECTRVYAMSGMLVKVFSSRTHQMRAAYSGLAARSIATAPPDHLMSSQCYNIFLIGVCRYSAVEQSLNYSTRLVLPTQNLAKHLKTQNEYIITNGMKNTKA
jgi:hypothetical protein